MSHGNPKKLRLSTTMGQAIINAMPGCRQVTALRRYEEKTIQSALCWVVAASKGSDVRLWTEEVRVYSILPLRVGESAPSTRFRWKVIVRGTEATTGEANARHLRILLRDTVRAGKASAQTLEALQRRADWIAERLGLDAIERLADIA